MARVLEWGRSDARGVAPPIALDDLHEVDLLVVDGISADDDDALGWLAHAPSVVVARTPVRLAPSQVVDVAVADGDPDELVDALAAGVAANPGAASVLVDVVRASERLGVADALVLESLAYSALLAGPEYARWMVTRPESSAPGASRGSPVVLQRHGGRLDITLMRPERRNALSADLRDALVEALAVAEVDPSISEVTVRGAGPSFCSGGDLAEFGAAHDVVTAHRIRTVRSVGARLHRLADRTTVQVHGPCVGAGVELAAFAGRVVARPDASFRLPEVAMGLIPGAGGTVSITRRIGRQAMTRMALTGATVDATEALALGLIDEITG